MELGRKNLEAPEQLETAKPFENEAARNTEQDKKRSDSIDKNGKLENTLEKDVGANKKEKEQHQTPEEKRSEKLEQKKDLYEKSPDAQTNKQLEAIEDSASSKTKLEDMSWNDIHQMQEKNPEKLEAVNKDYQERVSAEGFGMSVEEYRAHLDRIEKANASEESQEETKTGDWRSQMENDLLQNSNMDVKEEQSEEKKDSAQEKYDKPERFSENSQDNLEDKEIRDSAFTMEDGKIELETTTSMERESRFENEVTGTQETRDEQCNANLNETQDLFKEESGVTEHSKMEEDIAENKDLDFKEKQLDQNEASLEAQFEKSEDLQEDVKDEETETLSSAIEDKKIEQEAQTSIESENYSEKEEKIPKENLEHSENNCELPKSQEVNQDDTKQADSVEVSEEKKEILQYSPEVQEKIERYSLKSFTKESSFDATVYNKDEICENNHILSEKDGEKMLSKEQIQEIKILRESVPHPTEDTVMQKVIPEEQLERYTKPNEMDINKYGGIIGGYISKAEDTAPFAKTPKEAFENLRLNYPGNKFNEGKSPIYTIRFNMSEEDIGRLSIPYSKDFISEGEKPTEDKKPFTGSGFLGSENYIIPEYKSNSINGDNKTSFMPSDGMIFKIYEDENGKPVEEPYAWYSEDAKRFVCIKRGEEDDR